VRDVAPNKLMLCVTFRVPPSVAFAGRQLTQQQQQQQQRRRQQGKQQEVFSQLVAAAANGAAEGSPAERSLALEDGNCWCSNPLDAAAAAAAVEAAIGAACWLLQLK
jgi:hypothetical protein